MNTMTQKVVKKRLLIVDDDEAILSFFEEIFPRKQYAVECISDGERALEMLRKSDFDVIVTDLCMPKMDGLKLIQEIHRVDPHAIVVAITGFGTIKDAVSLMKTGAYDVLTKPFSLDEIRTTIDKAIRHSRLTRDKRALEQRLKVSERLTEVGRDIAVMTTDLRDEVAEVGRLVQAAIEKSDASVATELDAARGRLNALGGTVARLVEFTDGLASEAEAATAVPTGDATSAPVSAGA